MNDLVNIIIDATKAGPVEQKYVCKYCSKSFVKESTLSAHFCENKRRFQQRDTPGVRLGFQTWLRFYELTQGSAKTKTYEDFVSSPYYLAFTKFGLHCCSIGVIDPPAFIDFVIKANKKLDHWTRDVVYTEYLFQYLRTESAQFALERAIKEMQNWADENGSHLQHYFLYASMNKVCAMIVNGKISPWVIYNCDSGLACLEKLSEEQLAIVWEWIHTDYWQLRFKDYLADTEWCKHILKQAGL